MDIKKIAGILVLLMICIMGCSGNYGKIRKQTGALDTVTIEELRDTWDNYDIYYGRRSNRYADAIMFDPKNNGTRLKGDSWTKIEDQESLDARIKDIHRIYNYVGVYLIEGANTQAFGYMYYPGYFHVVVSIVDERTLHISSLPKYKSTP